MNRLRKHYERKAADARDRLENGPAHLRDGARLDLEHYESCASWTPSEGKQKRRRRGWRR